MKIKDRVAHEIETGTFWEAMLIIFKTYAAWFVSLLNTLSFAMIDSVNRAEPVEMREQLIKKFVWHISEGCSRIEDSNLKLFTPSH